MGPWRMGLIAAGMNEPIRMPMTAPPPLIRKLQ